MLLLASIDGVERIVLAESDNCQIIDSIQQIDYVLLEIDVFTEFTDTNVATHMYKLVFMCWFCIIRKLPLMQ